jgi:phage-related protein|tara:strand:- start:69 stop:410 length:342 start_codon:yes stop_codon:yes gene_type:complete
MATFPIANPIYNTRINTNTDQIVVSFGDGFEQRLTTGLNQNPITVNLVFEVASSVANTAVDFLQDRIEDGASFEFTLPDETTARKFVCTRFPRTLPFLNRTRLSCVFREVFEP